MIRFETLGAPPDVAAALARLQEDLARAAGPNLSSLVLYGSLARGRFRPRRSDVNLLVVLEDASARALAAIAPALKAAFRAVRVEPMVLAARELARAACAFPTKLLDLKAHHLVLLGEDPLAALHVEPEVVRRRVEQELRNHALRLRRRLVVAHDDPAALDFALASLAVPLSVELDALRALAGAPPPDGDTPAALLAGAADALGLDRACLDGLAALGEGRWPGDLAVLAGSVLRTLERAAGIAASSGAEVTS